MLIPNVPLNRPLCVCVCVCVYVCVCVRARARAPVPAYVSLPVDIRTLIKVNPGYSLAQYNQKCTLKES